MYAIAKQSGVHPAQIGRFIKKEKGLAIGSITALCDALGLVLVKRKRPAPKPLSRVG